MVATAVQYQYIYIPVVRTAVHFIHTRTSQWWKCGKKVRNSTLQVCISDNRNYEL
jgi:hypothetical protein